MPPYCNVFRTFVELWVLCKCNRSIIIASNQGWTILGKAKFPMETSQPAASRAASDNATYSASVDESAIVDCFFDLHVMAPPPARKTYPDVDFKSSAFA